MIQKLSQAGKKLLNKEYIWIPQPGERVEITVKQSKHGNVKTPKNPVGTIDSTDGHYIMVKLDSTGTVGEYYLPELKLIETNERITTKKKR